MVGVRTVSVQTEGRAPAPTPTTSAPCTIAVQTDPSVEPMEALEQRLAAIEQHIVSRDSSASPATSPVEAESMSPAATNAKAIFRSLDTNGDGRAC